MANKIHNNFKLLGYKINELSNRYFITRKPNGSESLFDSNGNILISNARNIKRVTDDTYSCIVTTPTNMNALINKHGDILGSGDVITRINKNVACVHVGYYYDLYLNNGTKIFSSLNSFHINAVLNIADEYKVVALTQLLEVHSIYSVTDTHGNTRQIDSLTDVSANNHYIKGKSTSSISGEIEDIDTVLSHQDDLIYKGRNVNIDTSNLDNDTIVAFREYTITVKHGEEELSIQNSRLIKGSIESYKIKRVEFTSHIEILKVTDEKGVYLLNVRTQMKSEYCSLIHTVPLYVLVRDGDMYNVARVETDTLEFDTIISSSMTKEIVHLNEYELIVTNKETLIHTYYDFEGNQLLHEF